MSGENRLSLEGRVCKAPETRQTPAGIPMTRFGLLHESSQIEAGIRRSVRVRISVMASGELAKQAQRLEVGSEVRVLGFVETKQDRQGFPRLILNAHSIEQV